MNGPKWKFTDPAVMEAAVNVCKQHLPADSWRVVGDDTIVFASVKAEELFSVKRSSQSWRGY